MGERNSTIRAREVGYQLRKLREGTGLKQSYVARRIGLSPASLSRIEDGTKPATPEEVSAILAVIEIVGPVRETLLDIARDVTQRGWIQYASTGLGQRVATLASQESRACAITQHATNVVPALLQTPEYVEAMMRTGRPLPEAEVNNRVRWRLARRHILFRDEPVQLATFISEHVLERVLGSTAVLHRQLAYLLKMMERPNVIIRVVPKSASTELEPIESFTLLNFPVAPPAVYVDNRACSIYLEEPEEIARYEESVHDLMRVTLDTGGSAELIGRLMGALEDDPDVLPKFDWPSVPELADAAEKCGKGQ